MDTSAFYAASSALCFTLLGFWWVVVEFRHAELTREPGVRRFAFLVSLHFILPGLVSLASLLTSGPLWRVAFGLAGIAGIAATVVGLWEVVMHAGPLQSIARGAWVALPLYVAVLGFAVDPDLARTAFALEPLQVEGYLLVLVLLVGVLLAWLLFTDPLAMRSSEERRER